MSELDRRVKRVETALKRDKPFYLVAELNGLYYDLGLHPSDDADDDASTIPKQVDITELEAKYRILICPIQGADADDTMQTLIFNNQSK